MPNVTQCIFDQETKLFWVYITQGHSDPESNLPLFGGGGTIGQPCTYLICMVCDKCHAY